MDATGTAVGSAPQMDPATLMRKWFDEVWNQGRAESIDELFPEHAIMWGVARPGIPSTGSAEFKQFYKALRSACPDIHIAIEKVVQEGDTAFARWTATMTHTGEGLGMPPTGNKVTLQGMSALRLQNGQVAEGWNVWDQVGLARQLGVLEGRTAQLFQ